MSTSDDFAALTPQIAQLANELFGGHAHDAPAPADTPATPSLGGGPGDLFAVPPDFERVPLFDPPSPTTSPTPTLAPTSTPTQALPSTPTPTQALPSTPTSTQALPSTPTPTQALPSTPASPSMPTSTSTQALTPTPTSTSTQALTSTPPSTPTSTPTSPSTPTSSFSFSPEVVPEIDVRPSPGIFDPHAVKRDFPILREVVNGRPLVWLDNAATTQKPQEVIDRLSYFYEHENSNVHRAAHTLAGRATDAYEGAREKVRRFLNAGSSKDIVWVRGTTEAINLVAKAWGGRNVQAGDEIVITWLEHHANIVPWQMLASEKGAKLRVAPVDSRGEIILEEYEKLLNPRTRIVSLTQVSNALGTVTPAKTMVEMAHRHGAIVLVDGAQAVSHMAVDVQELDADFYVFSGHKVFGPTGIGALYGKPDVLAHMPPWQGGGNMIADVTFERTVYQGPPSRFEAGTGNIADAVGLGAAVDYVTRLGLPNISRYEHELRVYGEEQLACVPGLRIIGCARDKAGVISFTLDGVRTEDVSAMLDKEGIAVRSGHHCAQPILRRFGLEATVRASLAPYNTKEDMDALADALKRIQVGR